MNPDVAPAAWVGGAGNDAELQSAFTLSSSPPMQQRITVRFRSEICRKYILESDEPAPRKAAALWGLGGEKMKEIKGRVRP